MALALQDSLPTITTPDLNIALVQYGVAFFLAQQWPSVKFEVMFEYNEESMRHFMIIVVPLPNGREAAHIREGISGRQFPDPKTFRMSDETIATITLLLG